MDDTWSKPPFGNQLNKMRFPHSLDKHKRSQCCYKCIQQTEFQLIWLILCKVKGKSERVKRTVSNSVNNVTQNISVANMRQSVFQQQLFHQLSSVHLQQRNFHTRLSIGFQLFSMYVSAFRVHRRTDVVLYLNQKSNDSETV